MQSDLLSEIVVLGIDPGADGGIAWINGNHNASAIVTPIIDKRIDFKSFCELLRDQVPTIVIIEKPQMMGTGSQQASLSSGINYGLMLGACFSRGIPVHEVSPITWKTKMGLTDPSPKKRAKGSDPKAKPTSAERSAKDKARKEKSIRLAAQTFPSVDLRASDRCRNYHDGKAEALLIAEYGRRFVLMGDRRNGS